MRLVLNRSFKIYCGPNVDLLERQQLKNENTFLAHLTNKAWRKAKNLLKNVATSKNGEEHEIA